MTVRTIHIYCDGGLGNRFNGLVAGLLLAKAGNFEPIVVWPKNNWCGASFEELFENDFNVLDRELVTYVPEKSAYQFLMTEDHLQMGVEFKSPLQMTSLSEALSFLSSADQDVYFHTPLIPQFFEAATVCKQVSELRFKAALEARAHEFIQERKLTDYFGLHIRKTDFGAGGSDDKNLFELVSNCPQKRFFVCSDDQSVEQRFQELPNAETYPKRAYVEMLVDGTWNTPTADHSGRVYACNVNRNAISVEDALIDLLILSYSQVVSTSNSTFRNTALLLQSARLTAN